MRSPSDAPDAPARTRRDAYAAHEADDAMRNAKVDANQAEIVEALEAVGAAVQSMAKVGDGCPDLLVSYRQRVFVMEVKTAKGQLRPKQTEWWLKWRGDVNVVKSADEALTVIGAKR